MPHLQKTKLSNKIEAEEGSTTTSQEPSPFLLERTDTKIPAQQQHEEEDEEAVVRSTARSPQCSFSKRSLMSSPLFPIDRASDDPKHDVRILLSHDAKDDDGADHHLQNKNGEGGRTTTTPGKSHQIENHGLEPYDHLLRQASRWGHELTLQQEDLERASVSSCRPTHRSSSWIHAAPTKNGGDRIRKN